MPTQTPRKGAPRVLTAWVTASITPGRPLTSRMQAANAPTPGSTMRSALAMMSGSSVVTTRRSPPSSRLARCNAFSAERRLPDP